MSLESELAAVRRALGQKPGRVMTVEDFTPPVMNIIDFARDVLGLSLFPAQALILKLIALESELFTPWDYQMLTKWGLGYHLADDLASGDPFYEGAAGTPPDVVDRVDHCRQIGMSNFREVVLSLGRRAGKSTIGAVLALYLMWRLLANGDPQQTWGVPPGKAMAIGIVSVNRGNATRDQFGDVRGMLLNAPAFTRYVEVVQSDTIRLYTPRQLASGARKRRERGLLEIVAVSTTDTALRGPALVGLLLDEFAHISGAGSTSDGASILRAAAPALAQFRGHGLTFMASSPWSKTGAFYSEHRAGCAVGRDTHAALYPDVLSVQLPSWEMYVGWEIAHELQMYPGGPNLDPKVAPIISEDDPEPRKLARLDPATYRVEYLAQWANSVDAYLTPEIVDAIFQPWQFNEGGRGRHRCVAHLDSSAVHDNMALVVAHGELIDGVTEMFVDVVHCWSPDDYGGTIPYDLVLDEAAAIINRYGCVSVSVDQYAGHAIAQMLTPRLLPAGARGLAAAMSRVQVFTAHSTEKVSRYEQLKMLAGEGRVHCPYHPLAYDELSALERRGSHIGAPTSGPVQTDDIPDALSWALETIMRGTIDVANQFGSVDLRATSSRPASEPGMAEAMANYRAERRQSHIRGATYVNPAKNARWNR